MGVKIEGHIRNHFLNKRRNHVSVLTFPVRGIDATAGFDLTLGGPDAVSFVQFPEAQAVTQDDGETWIIAWLIGTGLPAPTTGRHPLDLGLTVTITSGNSDQQPVPGALIDDPTT